MPVNKDAFLRYKVINKCLRNTMRNWTKKALLEAINAELEEQSLWQPGKKRIEIKDRQLNYDINAMRSEFGAPIEQRRDNKAYYYFYADSNYSLEELQISAEDLSYLQQAVELLNELKGFSISQDVAQVVSRLENRISIGEQGKGSKAIAFENPPQAIGTENLSDLFESILKKMVLKIHYKPFTKNGEGEYSIHPYFLKEYNNRWFLFCWNEENNRLENLALDRMVSIKVQKKAYRENDCFDPDTYFADIIGVTRPEKEIPQNIVIKVDSLRAPYVHSKPIHHSQHLEHKYADGSIKFSYMLILNRELVAQLLSFGPQLEVIEPDFLRKQMKETFEKCMTIYK